MKPKKYTGNLLSYLNEGTQNAIRKNAAAPAKEYEIHKIDVRKIRTNQDNFYDICDIEALAARIALSHHITPLEVVEDKADSACPYRLISGERRRAATLLRFERGEIDLPIAPCIIREDFQPTGKLTAHQVEIINLICANDYRDKTPFEKLDEVQKLMPIAKTLFEDKKDEFDSFRQFFAEDFLGISQSALQRILVLENLVPEARSAFKQNLIKKTALSKLAAQPPEEQLKYIEQLENGEAAGTVSEVIENAAKTVQDTAQESESSSDITEAEETYEEAWEKRGQTKLLTEEEAVEPTDNDKDTDKDEKTSPSPISINPEKAQQDANAWVIEGLQNMRKVATDKMTAAKEQDNNSEAAQWDLRRAAVNLVIETITE